MPKLPVSSLHRALAPLALAPLALAPLALASLAATLAGCPRDTNSLPDAFIAWADANERDAVATLDANVERCEDPGSTLGEACATNQDCNDLCYCNGLEECRDGRCQAGNLPCREDEVECTNVSCDEGHDRCVITLDHELCSDGDACNGAEQCNPLRGCQDGSPPVCNDEDSCTVDSCDPATGCVYTLRDLDGDGHVAVSCGGDDCDDDPRYGALIFPGARELCDNRRDDDCDGDRDYYDADCVPTNDTCDVATILELDASGGTFSGSTSTLRRDYPLACGGTGADAVFRFHLDAPRDVRVSATASGAALALRAFDRCASGPEEKCNVGSPPTILRRSLPAGDWAIIVSTTTPQPFDLNVRLSDPTATPTEDLCSATTPVIPAGGGVVTGNFGSLEDDYRTSCNAAGGRDAVYAVDVPAGALMDLRVDAVLDTTSYVYVYAAITSDCDLRTAELACSGGYRTGSVTRRELGPGRYYVILEPNTADPVAYTATFTLTPSPPRAPGDTCESPIDIAPASFPGTRTEAVSVSSLDPLLDARPSCGSTSGRDAVFRFTLPVAQDVTLTGTGGAGTLYATLRGADCAATASERSCWSAATPLVRTFRSLPAGDYHYVLETTSTTGTLGATLETRAPTPVPTNDACAAAIPLTPGTTRRDTLVGFTNDLNVPTCSGGTTNHPDAFYTFTLTSRRSVLIDVSRDSGGVVYAALLSSCASATPLACGTSTGTTNTVRATLDPGTYFVIVEMPSAATSEFALQFFTADP